MHRLKTKHTKDRSDICMFVDFKRSYVGGIFFGSPCTWLIFDLAKEFCDGALGSCCLFVCDELNVRRVKMHVLGCNFELNV